MFSFNPQKINFEEELGSGQWGVVYPYDQKAPDDFRWVVKHVLTKNMHDVLSHVQEIVLGFSCDHPYVVPVKGYHIDFDSRTKTWNLYIKLPRMMSSLESKIKEQLKKNTEFKEEELVKYFYALTTGFLYLHGKKIVHRDIKPSNILIDENGEVKISDIGIGKFIEDETARTVKDFSGTLSYSAPEIINHNIDMKTKDLLKSDIWSLGVVMIELCTLKKIIDLNKDGEQKTASLVDRLKEVEGKYSQFLLDLIASLVKSNPSDRNSLENIQRSLAENYSDILNAQMPCKSTSTQTMEGRRSEEFITENLQKKLAFLTAVRTAESERMNLLIMDQSKLIKEWEYKYFTLEKEYSSSTADNERLNVLVTDQNKLIKEWESKYSTLEKDYLNFATDNERMNLLIMDQSKLTKEWESKYSALGKEYLSLKGNMLQGKLISNIIQSPDTDKADPNQGNQQRKEIRDEKSEAYFQKALELAHYHSKEEESLVYFTAALFENINDFEVYFERANVLRILKKYNEALKDLDQSIAIQPTASAYFIKCRTLAEIENTFDAKMNFGLGEILLNENVSAWCHYGGALYSLKKIEEALNAFEKAITISPDFPRGYFCMAVTLNNLERKKEAVEVCDRLIKANPLLSQAHYYLGYCLHDVGMREEAIKAYDRAIELDPKHSKAYFNKGCTLRALGRYEEAIKALDKSIEIDPQYAYAHYHRGLSLKGLGRQREAIRDYDRAIELKINYSKVYYEKGVALLDMGEYDEGFKALDKAIELNPRDYDSYFSKGYSLLRRGQYEESIQEFQKAAEIRPNSSPVYFSIGLAQDRLHRSREAIKSYDKAIEINPKDARACLEKGNILSSYSEFNEALEAYNKAVEAKPDYAEVYHGRGLTLFRLKKYEEALQDYDKAKQIGLKNDKFFSDRIEALEKRLTEKWESVAEFCFTVKIFSLTVNSQASQNAIRDIIMDFLDIVNYDANVVQLNLSFILCKWVDDAIVRELAAQIASKFNSLPELRLQLKGCNISDNGVKELVIQLGSNLKELITLNLEFPECIKITDQGSREIAIQLGTNFKSLKDLSLDYSGSQITVKTLKELIPHVLRNLNNLENISVGCNDCKSKGALSFSKSITEKDKKEFIETLRQAIPKLKE